jgi:hypothetical protein
VIVDSPIRQNPAHGREKRPSKCQERLNKLLFKHALMAKAAMHRQLNGQRNSMARSSHTLEPHTSEPFIRSGLSVGRVVATQQGGSQL